MSARRLSRMVVRVDPQLGETLNEIAQRLSSETRCDYSLAAIVRGLIALGLHAVAGAPLLAELFVGARVKRGRRRGVYYPPRAPVRELDR